MHDDWWVSCTAGDFLDLWLGRREIASFALRQEAATPVSAVAEWFVFGQTAAAQRDRLAACETERVPFKIGDLEIPFDADGPVP